MKKQILLSILLLISASAFAKADKMTCGVFEHIAIGKPKKIVSLDLDKNGYASSIPVTEELFFHMAKDQHGNFAAHFTVTEFYKEEGFMFDKTRAVHIEEENFKLAKSVIDKFTSGDSFAFERADYMTEEKHMVVCYALGKNERAPFEDDKSNSALAETEVNDQNRDDVGKILEEVSRISGEVIAGTYEK
ncbi:MAG: hypothetical protein GY909_07710 [Oligoflexia bacterium]|nr:hypothetical protein [Oligoflexia bacterium]